MSCTLCSVSLKGAFGSKKRTKYCDSCASGYHRLIFNLWHRRAYQKRRGKVPESMTYQAMIRTKERYMEDKTKRNEQIREMRKQGMTLKEIGSKFGISRQRVHKLI